MAKTIIQTIGPLYGEEINGTVFGRPNGSIFIPSQNTIAITLAESYRYIIKTASLVYYVTASASGVPSGSPSNQANFVAESQDIANYVKFEVSADNFDTVIAGYSLSAGIFNGASLAIARDDNIPDIEDGATYYLRAVLVSASGVPVATSNIIELTGVVPE